MGVEKHKHAEKRRSSSEDDDADHERGEHGGAEGNANKKKMDIDRE